MDSGKESEVVKVFADWLVGQGWSVHTEVAGVDVVAERDGEHLVAEAKGITSSPGLDIDTGYGQLLRRMTDLGRTSYAIVVPEKLVRVASRVPAEVRTQLNIRLFGVDMDDLVREHKPTPD